MKRLLLILTVICASVMTTQAQDEKTYHQLCMEYLRLNGSAQQYEDGFDQLMVMLKRQYKGHPVTKEQWRMLAEQKDEQVLVMHSLLSSVYRRVFDREDLEKMIGFYSTDTGKKFAADPTNLTEEDRMNLSGYYNSPTGQKLMQGRGELEKLVAEVSEYWSRDLYKDMTGKLAAMGYKLGE